MRTRRAAARWLLDYARRRGPRRLSPTGLDWPALGVGVMVGTRRERVRSWVAVGPARLTGMDGGRLDRPRLCGVYVAGGTRYVLLEWSNRLRVQRRTHRR